METTKESEKEARLPVQQLAILSICRFAEPLALTSVFPYLPEMIESFNVPHDDVAQWAGVTSLAFSLSQAVTSIQWGRASDTFGRKPVILVALTCAMATSLLFGFSQNLPWAIAARALAGASNGNVGILRTAVAELVPQKSLQPMAFAVMPMIWAIGSSFGPILGGVLAVPTRQYPGLFGGNAFLEKFKFALPNLVASAFFTTGIVTGFLFLRETLETKRHKKDYGLILGRNLTQGCSGKRSSTSRKHGLDPEALPTTPIGVRKHLPPDYAKPKWSEVFTSQSTLNILSYTILAFHAVTFDQLVPVFLHHPLQDHNPASGNVTLPFKFSGGLGLDSGRIGVLFTAMGVVGIVAQFVVFPPVTRHFGSLVCFRAVTFVFPMIYFLLPYTALLQSDGARQGMVFALMFIKSILSTFAFPCTTILLTNSAKSVRILGTLNGVAVATSALGRASGPFIGGGMFTWGVKRGYVIVPWFILSFFAVLGHISTWWLLEMDGPTSSVVVNEVEEDQQEEEIILLPNESDANAGQVAGILVAGEDGAQKTGPGGADDLPYHEPDEDNDEGIGEHSPLLRAVPLRRGSSRESRLNIGGASLTLSRSK